MKVNNKGNLKTLSICLLITVFLVSSLHSFSQEQKYYPKGDPDKWNFSFTPFLILPWVNGELQSEILSKELGIGPSDFLNSLNGTLMLNTELSKGKFFFAPSYIYNYNDVEKILWTSDNGNQSIVAEPSLQRHILEVIAGMRLRLGTKFILDPYAGFRYTSYHVFGSIQGFLNSLEFDEQEDFWDPIIGIKTHYYPHPRVPIELKADIGGFGAGSKLTWSTWLNSGYVVSPVVDIIAGFGALNNEYESKTESGNTYGMTSLTYGISVGARFYFPKRFRDPVVFKKTQNKQ